MVRLMVLAVLVATTAAVSLLLNDTTFSLNAARNLTLPSSFKWTSTDALVFPKNDSRAIAGIKDPSIVQIDNTYHLDQAPLGIGYRAAPEVFYFEPQNSWYLVYQNGNAAFSTNKNINDPAAWTEPKTFYNGTPALIQEGLEGGYWVDMWVICDDENCHLFSSDDNGRLYRSQTAITNFPNNMSDPVIALQEPNKGDLYEASNVYSVGNGQYLLLVECMGTESTAGGTRYFRSWTSTDLAGPWTTLAATESNPFLGATNVRFEGKQWTKSLSHGEIIRTNTNQRLELKPCDMRFLYQGVEPTADTEYNALPWRLGLVKQTESSCKK